MKVKILEIQNIGKDNEMKVTRKHQAKIQAVMEKNLVLQKIKQSEFIPNKENIEDIEIFDSLPSIQEQNVFASKLFCEKKLSKQNMLSVSPSRNYLLNLENIEKVKYEYSPNTPFLDESKL